MSAPTPTHRRRLALLLPIVLGGLWAACDDNSTPTSPTTTTTTTTGPATETWATQIGVQGSASRSIDASAAGTLELSLTETTPAGVVMGLSVGVPRAGSSGCLPTRTVQASADGSTHIVSEVIAGTYCVQVNDLGTLTGPTRFTVTIKRP